MDKKQKIANKIYDTYTKRLSDLPSKERIHFARRAYRATGDAYFADIMKEWALRHTVPAIKKGSVVVQGVVDKKKAYPKVRIKDNSTNPRNIKRKAVLEEKPEIQFYRRYLMNLFQAHLMEVQKSHLSNDWEGFISYLKEVEFEKVLMNEKAIFGVSSFAVNCAYFVSHLGVDEGFSHKFVDYLKGLYFDSDGTLKVELDKYEFITLIYNLTHIIIAESKFY
ncbi:MAG: DUF3541 domain-containing protein [Halomonas sp.]|nr:DUF3541 domain-containing protein [Halomonas sp.]MCC5903051.1 DUF3541 domain-containing protein [Halomonas sp.]